MKICSLLFTVLILFCLLALNTFKGFSEEVEVLLLKGEECLDSALYSSAIQYFEEGLEHETNRLTPFLKQNLIRAYYLKGDYSKVLELTHHQVLSEQELYYSGLSLKSLMQFEEAKSIFSSLYKKYSKPIYLIEKGICEYYLKQLSQSRQSLLNAIESNITSDDSQIGYLYLSRIFLEENLLEEAEKFLKKIPSKSSYGGEVHYLLGEILFIKKEFSLALTHFEKAYSKFCYQPSLWHKDVLNYLVNCHLSLVEIDKEHSYSKAIHYLKSLATLWPEEETLVKLSKCLISFGELTEQETALTEANHYISLIDLDKNPELKTEILMLKAQTQTNYLVKDKIYKQLIDQENLSEKEQAQIWYFKGMNEFEQALRIQEKGDRFYSDHLFEKALQSFHQAYGLYIRIDPYWTVQCLIRSAQILTANQQSLKKQKAITLLQSFLDQQPSTSAIDSSNEEFLYLLALYAAHQSESDSDNCLEYQNLSKSILLNSLNKPSHTSFYPESLKLLATLYVKETNVQLAIPLFSELLEKFPNTAFEPEALFWIAQCYEKDDIALARQKRMELYQKYPTHPLAAEAFFRCYHSIDYLQGDKTAIKHLKIFPELFQQSPLLLNAYYLLGLNCKRDRKSLEGKWIGRKNLIASKECFQQVQSYYKNFVENNIFLVDQLEYYTQLTIRSHLEEAQANLAIAEESEGTKKLIFLEYAEQGFQQIYFNLNDVDHHYSRYLTNRKALLSLQAECLLYWAKTELAYQKEESTEQLLDKIIKKYQEAKIAKSYFLANAWEEKGRISLKNQNYRKALQELEHACDAAKGKLYSDDQRLELGILKSECYAKLNELDQALLTLSNVINDEAISSLRLKAMYLRSEIYSKQNRVELAKRQLEALARQNGEWALKARQKLEEHYGY